MGIWGYQVFANDTAADYADGITQQLMDDIEASLADTGQFSDEIAGQGNVLPALAMLVALCTGDKDIHFPFDITTERLQKWQDRYLTAYDAAVAQAKAGTLPYFNTGMSDASYRRRRRVEIIKVFDAAASLIADRNTPTPAD